MKNNLSRLILICSDIFVIFASISIAYILRMNFDSEPEVFDNAYWMTVTNIYVYAIILVTFFNEKIYKFRFDFWQETRLVLRGLVISLVLTLSLLAVTKSIDDYSRFVVIASFVFMGVFIPIIKNIMKKSLFKIGLWKREAEVCGNDNYTEQEVFGNSYLGYIYSIHASAKTIFIDTNNLSAKELQERLDVSLQENKEVLFIPLLQTYSFANARIIELTNARKNLIVLENSLLKISNILIKKISDIVLSTLLFPFFVLFFIIIVILIKKEEPKGSVFFKQKRMGQGGREFTCYKFRSMHEDGEKTLEAYLKENPDEIACYDEFHKYKNDPRITKVGHFLRKTSLDELPQIINVLKGEMSLIGPRPYLPNEREKIGDKLDMVLAAKPGITGLWQVSGRNDVDFCSRVDMDVWYTRNWNLWLDLIILVKTIKVVLFRRGAC